MGSGFWQPYDLFTKKLLGSKSDGRLLKFPEVMLGELRDAVTPAEFEAAGAVWVHNTPAEISALVREMMDRLGGVAAYTPEDETFQQAFRSLLRARQNIYTFGLEARMGRDFARTHRDLFGNLHAGVPLDSPGSLQTVVALPQR
jgi:hypothetical protein